MDAQLHKAFFGIFSKNKRATDNESNLIAKSGLFVSPAPLVHKTRFSLKTGFFTKQKKSHKIEVLAPPECYQNPEFHMSSSKNGFNIHQ